MALILEEMGLESVGTHGTTAALTLLNDRRQKRRHGLQSCWWFIGCFIPVSEDAGMIKAVESGLLNLEKS